MTSLWKDWKIQPDLLSYPDSYTKRNEPSLSLTCFTPLLTGMIVGFPPFQNDPDNLTRPPPLLYYSTINDSITSVRGPTVRIISILTNPTLDPSEIRNYQMVSLFSFLSKILISTKNCSCDHHWEAPYVPLDQPSILRLIFPDLLTESNTTESL